MVNLSSLNVVRGMLLVTLLEQRIDGNIQVESFQKKKGDSATSASSTFVSARSKLHCATMCSNDETCASFAYNKNTKCCEMANENVPGLEKSVYVKTSSPKKACPVEKGYRRWDYPDMTLCLRSVLNGQLNQQETEDRCNQDGGHLVLVDSNSKRSRLVQAVSEMGVPYKDLFFIDGYDKSKNRIFFNWKEEELTWLSWYPGEPNRGSNYCMITGLYWDFWLVDGICSTRRNSFLCEIDVF